MTVLAPPPLTDLGGTLLTPDDADYPLYATPWNVAVPSAPAAVVRPADADDVVAAVRFARTHGLRVDVRATGHGAAPVSGGTLLVHTGLLDELTVHPEGWARVGAGVKWNALLEAAAPYGLAGLCGSSPGIGVVGYLTGGGNGPVARTFGFACDRVRAFDVVTGDGVLRRVTPEDEPDLFWGLRGGKGALGIVTAVEIDLVAVAEVYGGALWFDGADAATVLHAWARWCPTLPEQATTSVAVVRLPDLPGVPPPLAGRCAVAVRFAWVGDPADGARAAAPIGSWAVPVLGGLATMPYAAIGAIHADPVDPMPATESAAMLHSLPPEAVDALLAVVGPDSDCPQVVVELRQLGGALARRPEHPSALCARDTAFSLLLIGVAVPPLLRATQANAGAAVAAVHPWSTGACLPNFTSAATAEAAAATYDPPVLARLGALARAYDPDSVLACADAVRGATQ